MRQRCADAWRGMSCVVRFLGALICAGGPAALASKGDVPWRATLPGSLSETSIGSASGGAEAEALSLQSTGSGSIQRVSAQEEMQKIADAMTPEFCGVIGEVNEVGGHVERHEEQPNNRDCHTSLLTNCTVSYWPLRCPSRCPFLVKDPAVSCFFKCTTRDECSTHNPETPWPDDTVPDHAICAECNVRLCKKCVSRRMCEECHRGFKKTEDGQSCVLALDLTWLDYTVQVVVVILIFTIILGIVWECIKGRHARSEQHMVACRRARLHRHLCKTVQWQLDSRHKVREWFAVSENVHTTNIAGVGLPLWYNSLCFMMLVALMCFGATFLVHHWYAIGKIAFGIDAGNQVLEFVEKHQGGKVIFEEDQTEIVARWPAMIVSSLKHCRGVDPDEDNKDLEDMATRMFYMVVVLYACLFTTSLWTGFKQKREAMEFDAEHATMADYVLRVTGIPADQTDEATVRDHFQNIFREAFPDKVERPNQIVFGSKLEELDHEEPEEPTHIEVYGVSLCYDFSDCRHVVDDAIWKLIEVQEVELFQSANRCPLNKDYLEGIYADHELQISDTSLYDPKQSWTHDMTANEAHHILRTKVKGLFEDDSKLRITGEAYVIFRYIRDREVVQSYLKEKPDAFTWKSGEKLSFYTVFSEPPSVFWWSSSFSEAKIFKRAVVALLKITLLILMLELCINLPYYWFIQRPYRDVGATATGLVTTVYGIVVSNVNGLIFWGIYMIGEGIGFHQKDTLYQFVAVTTVFFIVVMTAINILLNAKLVVQKYDHDDMQALFGVSVKFLGVEIAFSEAIYNMLPGYLFAGSFGKIVMPQLMYIWVQVLQKIIYVWRCLPDPFLRVLKIFLPYKPESLEHLPFRNAEKGVDPWEIPVMGDYADWVANPMLCFFMLMFMSAYVWKIFRLMFFWVVFHYFYFRYTHLRYHRVNYYTTHRLNTVGMYMWGGALGMLAAMIPLWGFRSGHMGPLQEWRPWYKVGIMGLAWIASVLLWLVTYSYAVRPWSQDDADEHDKRHTFDDIKDKFVFSWLNTNPVYVLKCRYFYKDENGDDIPHRRQGHPLASGEDPNQVRFFEVGKEYLFIRPERQYLLAKNMSDFMEPEYWIDRVSWRLGQFSGLFQARVRSHYDASFSKLSAAATDSAASAEPLMNGQADH